MLATSPNRTKVSNIKIRGTILPQRVRWPVGRLEKLIGQASRPDAGSAGRQCLA